MCDIACFDIALETRMLVKLVDAFFLRTGEEHYFIAILFPGSLQGVMQQSGPDSQAAVISMGHDVLYKCVRASASREVGNNDEDTGTGHGTIHFSHEAGYLRIMEQFIPNALNFGFVA
jgi:hypothetical protein